MNTPGQDPTSPSVRMDARAEGNSRVFQAGQDLHVTYQEPPALRAMATAIHTLPRDIAGFIGRNHETSQIVNMVDAVTSVAESGQVIGIHAIDGMAGVGKTAFAVHAAHLLAARFPDGQIFLDLHAHTPGQRPVKPADALSSLLLTTGVPAQFIPPDLDSRTAMWRDRLAERRMLVLLDDAASYQQIRPLLPSAPGCLVLVTSRRRLAALEDVVPLSLDTLPPPRAAELFIRLVPAAQGEADGVAHLTELCGHLPLAIGLLAGRLRHHPTWTVADLIIDLTQTQDRLAQMRAENVTVRSAFDLSFRDLPADGKRLLRRLGLHPGPDIDAYAAAALAAISLTQARQDLDTLYNDHLIDEPSRGRYQFHDLIGAYARDLARRENRAGREAAIDRLFDYYRDTASVADRQIPSVRHHPDPPPAGKAPVAVPELPTPAHALAWLEAERANLIACTDYAIAQSCHVQVVAIAKAIAGFVRTVGPWDQAQQLHHAASTAAQRVGDKLGQAEALSELGAIQYLTGDYAGAAETLAESLSLYSKLDNQFGQADALFELGVVRRLTGDYRGAVETLSQAATLSHKSGNRLCEANALTELGAARYQIAMDYPGAIEALTRALSLHRELGNQLGEVDALFYLGSTQSYMGDGYGGAVNDLNDALTLARDIGYRLGQADSLCSLGRIRSATRDYQGAVEALTEALALYSELCDTLGQANALNELGVVWRGTRDYAAAIEAHNRALDLSRHIGYRNGQAIAMRELRAVEARKRQTEHARNRKSGG